MGIYDREYYRRETSGSLWLTGQSPVTIGLVIVNVAIFLLLWVGGRVAGLGDWLELEAGRVLSHLEIWRLLTATFLHGGVWHLAGNMLFLWWFGRELEMLYGSREFIIFYLTAAIVSSLGWTIATWLSQDVGVRMVGASGAVTAVTVLFAMHNPRRRILFYGFIPVEMRWMVVIYLAADLYGLFGVDYSPIAHVAHLGGAAFAVCYKYGDLRVGRIPRRRLFGFRPRLRVVRPEPIRDPEPSESLDESLEYRMDEVLAKIAREGPQSLSDKERQILEEASRRLRSRRE